MTTRSGTTYKQMEEQTTHAEGTTADGPMTRGNALPELASLTQLIHVMVGDRERRDKEIAEERERMETHREEDRRRYTEESERRIQEMYRQMEHLQRLVTERSVPSTSRSGTEPITEPIKLTRLGEKDDIEAYLTTFERIMEAHEVNRERCSFKFTPRLTGKAQQVYASLPPDDAKSYDAVNVAILRRYNINEETYRLQFRSLQPKEEESPKELMTRLEDLATRWTRETTTHKELLDLVVREQFLSVLPADVRVAVMERKPKDCKEASQFAENYLQARAMSIVTKDAKAPTTKCSRCRRHGHWAQDCTKRQGSDERDPAARTTTNGGLQQRRNPGNQTTRDARPRSTDGVRYFNCNERVHISSTCPKRSLYCSGSKLGITSSGPEMARRQWTVNGVFCPDILVDTGATQTVVRKELVTDDDILDGEVMIQCAHGDTASYPLAVVKIYIEGNDIITTAAVSSTLPASILLEWDVPQLMNFVPKESPQSDGKEVEGALVVTRLQQTQPQPDSDQPEPTGDDDQSGDARATSTPTLEDHA